MFSLLRTGGNSITGEALACFGSVLRDGRIALLSTSSRVPDSTPLLRGPPSQSLSWAALNCSRAVGVGKILAHWRLARGDAGRSNGEDEEDK